MSPRAAAKSLLEALMVGLGPAALARRAFRHRGVVLAYHNVVPVGERPAADRSLHLSERAFKAQVDLLERNAEIVPLSELLVGGRREARLPRVAITFDDAYRGAIQIGLAELARRGHPATLFVSPGCLGGEGFWWDRISAPGTGFLPESFRAAALTAAHGRTEAVLTLAHSGGLAIGVVPAHDRIKDAVVNATGGKLKWGLSAAGFLPPDIFNISSEIWG